MHASVAEGWSVQQEAKQCSAPAKALAAAHQPPLPGAERRLQRGLLRRCAAAALGRRLRCSGRRRRLPPALAHALALHARGLPRRGDRSPIRLARPAQDTSHHHMTMRARPPAPQRQPPDLPRQTCATYITASHDNPPALARALALRARGLPRCSNSSPICLARPAQHASHHHMTMRARPPALRQQLPDLPRQTCTAYIMP